MLNGTALIDKVRFTPLQFTCGGASTLKYLAAAWRADRVRKVHDEVGSGRRNVYQSHATPFPTATTNSFLHQDIQFGHDGEIERERLKTLEFAGRIAIARGKTASSTNSIDDCPSPHNNVLYC